MTEEEEAQAALVAMERNALIIGLACLVAQNEGRVEIAHEFLHMVSNDQLDLVWFDDMEQALRVYELRWKNNGTADS